MGIIECITWMSRNTIKNRCNSNQFPHNLAIFLHNYGPEQLNCQCCQSNFLKSKSQINHNHCDGEKPLIYQTNISRHLNRIMLYDAKAGRASTHHRYGRDTEFLHIEMRYRIWYNKDTVCTLNYPSGYHRPPCQSHAKSYTHNLTSNFGYCNQVNISNSLESNHREGNKHGSKT